MRNQLGEEITNQDMVDEFAQFVDDCEKVSIAEAWAGEFGRKPFLIENIEKE